MIKHTPEPWATEYRERDGSYRQEIFDVNGEAIAYLAWFPIPTATGTTTNRKENARRIVACVNACAGWATEQLEAMEIGSMKETISRLADANSDATTWEARATKEASSAADLQAQVDELLAAAKHMLNNVAFVNFGGQWNNSFVEDADLTEYCQPLQDVINKITGEPK